MGVAAEHTGGNGGGPFTDGVGPEHPAFGLVSLVPAGDRLRVDWRSVGSAELEVGLGLFLSTSRSELFAGAPVNVPSAESSHVFEGLLGDVQYFVGLGVDLADDGRDYVPVGPVLSGTTFLPVFANPLADPQVADGSSPETAYPNLFVAVLRAFLTGAGNGGNVWLAEGTFEDVSLPLLEGVHLYGGFGPGFELDLRDPQEHGTVLAGLAAQSVIKLEAAAGVQIIDGLEIDGLGASATGVDLDQTPADLRGLTVKNCARGLRIRSPHSAPSTALSLTQCSFVDNQVEGLSLDGAYSLTLEGCTFQTNGQEGLEFGPWIAPAGETVSLAMRDCRFSGNGLEGLDIDLATAAGAVGPGGAFTVLIEDCLFEQNGTSGLLIDLDFEASPEWSAEIVVRGCHSRANAAHGVALDLDAPATCLIHRLLSTANGLDGLSVTSETLPGLLTVSASALVANLGAGLRSSLGNVGVALGHCVLAGNAQAGVSTSQSSATAASCVAHLQPLALSGVRLDGTLDLPALPAPFLHAPVEYRSVLGNLGGVLQLDAALESGLDGILELASDGVLRVVETRSGAQISLSPAVESPPLPTRLAVFVGGDSVDEDYGPSPTSPLFGAGMGPPSGETVDAGPLGAALGGPPGRDELLPPVLFRVAGSEPSWGQPIAPEAQFRVRFCGGTPATETLAGGLRLIDGAGVELPLRASLEAGELVVDAPPGGWANGDFLELHSTLLSRTALDPLVAVLLPIGAH